VSKREHMSRGRSRLACWARSLTWGLIPGSWDHNLSRRQTLNNWASQVPQGSKFLNYSSYQGLSLANPTFKSRVTDKHRWQVCICWMNLEWKASSGLSITQRISSAGTSYLEMAGISDGQNVSPHLLCVYVLDWKSEKGRVEKKSCNSLRWFRGIEDTS